MKPTLAPTLFAHYRPVACALLATACLTPPPLPAEHAAVANPSDSARAVPSDGAAGQPPKAGSAPQAFSHTSRELVRELDLGWNLGNSLDVPDGETAWGNPAASLALLETVASAGFDLVRIPVTWSKHMGPGPDFSIDPNFFARVDEVVGYAHAAGLYAIINVHHDGADGFKDVEWITLNDAAGNTTDENNEAVRRRFVTVWKQIAAHFAGHGEDLLFESMNEIHDGYGKPDPRHFTFVNELNQEFVTLVRQSGGNNAQRHLVVPGYNTNIDHTLEGFRVPDDPTKDRLILSVHYYDPYLFALQAKTHTWGENSPGRDDWGQEDFVVKQFDKLEAKYVDHGLPVIIGEYGATYQSDFEDYRRYYMEYVTKAAVDRGLLPVYWDNGGRSSGGENFALFDRRDNTVLHPELLAAMKRAATHSYSLDDIAKPKAPN